MDRNITYKSGTTPSAYTLSTPAQYYRHPEQPIVFAQTAVCTDNAVATVRLLQVNSRISGGKVQAINVHLKVTLREKPCLLYV